MVASKLDGLINILKIQGIETHMLYIFISLIAVVFAVLVILAVKFEKIKYLSYPEPSKKFENPRTLEERLSVLTECGVKPASFVDVNYLLQYWDRSHYESEDWTSLLLVLGMAEEHEPKRNHCENLWHFDLECIRKTGDYTAVVTRMVNMAGGAIDLSNISDYYSPEDKKACIEFDYKGKNTRIDCVVDGQWIDTDIFSDLSALLEENDPNKVFILYPMEGQGCIIGCVTLAGMDDLRAYGVDVTLL